MRFFVKEHSFHSVDESGTTNHWQQIASVLFLQAAGMNRQAVFSVERPFILCRIRLSEDDSDSLFIYSSS